MLGIQTAADAEGLGKVVKVVRFLDCFCGFRNVKDIPCKREVG